MILHVYAFVILLVAFSLWLPFGFATGITGDAWIYFMQVNEGNPFTAASATRLFLPTVWVAAHALTPGSFVGINVVALLLLFGKSWLLLLIVRQLTGHTALAFGTALLYLVLPADTGIFYLGALAIHATAGLFLTAVYCFIRFEQSRQPHFLAGMMLALLPAVGTYELVYPFVAITPLLVLRGRITRRWLRLAALWYAVPLLYALWYAGVSILFPRAAAYQTSLIAADRSLVGLLESLAFIVARHFVGGWFDLPPTVIPVFAGVALTAGVVVGAVWRTEQPRPPVRWAWVGVAILLTGVLLYLPTPLSHVTQRTYYLSGMGAAFTLAVLLLQFAGRWRLVGRLGMSVLVALGTYLLLWQHERYVSQSEAQQAAVMQLAAAVPALTPETVLVVRDADGTLTRTLEVGWYVEYIVPALYDDYSLAAALCAGSVPDGAEVYPCRFDGSAFTTGSVRQFALEVPYSRLVVLDYSASTGFSIVTTLDDNPAYAPERRIIPTGTNRARALFE